MARTFAFPSGRKAPGETRLQEKRAGIGPRGFTHLVVITAPSFVALNEYLDTLHASDDYAAFAKEVASISSLEGTAFYKRVKTWRQ